MKQQYFGDLSDYVKYGILRAVIREGLTLSVCWMLTPDDARSDGRFVRYLTEPQRFRRYDSDLFDVLADAVPAGQRDTAVLEATPLLADTVFDRAVMPETAAAREAYFEDLWYLSAGRRVIFFDPDNGLEIPSTRYGCRGSTRYLYWHEAEAGWRRGFSLIVFQHYRREPRIHFVDRLLGELAVRFTATPFALTTPRVAFLVVPQAVDAMALMSAGEKVSETWRGLISSQTSGA
jgi:hypothetical protein